LYRSDDWKKHLNQKHGYSGLMTESMRC
jgi:hypothetical protein